MKLRFLSMVFILLLSTSITACALNKSDSNPANTSKTSSTNTISDTNSPTTTSSVSTGSKNDILLAKKSSDNTNNDADRALKAYKVVLQNKAEFLNTENKKSVYLNNFLLDNGSFDCVFKTLHFAVLDMDGDKIPEVIIELAINNNNYAEFYEVLHYADGKVYGYLFSNRCLGGVKSDSTFVYSSGVNDNGFGKLRFQDGNSITDSIGHKESKGSNDEAYFIGDKQVKPEEYNSFEEEQFAKKDTTWYEFSQNSMDKILSVNP